MYRTSQQSYNDLGDTFDGSAFVFRMDHPVEDPRETLAKSIIRCRGALHRVSWEMGIHRSHIYRLTYRHELWPLVNRMREKAKRDRGPKKHRYHGGVNVLSDS